MGFAIAQAAAQRGAEVTLIAGPVTLPTPACVKRIDVESAQEMYQQVMDIAPSQDIFYWLCCRCRLSSQTGCS